MHRIGLIALVAIAACSGPALTTPPATPPDLVELTSEVFAEFVAAFPARTGCIGSVVVEGAWEMSDRAVYFPADRRIVVRIPGTAAQLTTSLIHELGHHLEHACPEQRDVRSAFLDALGFPPGTEWPADGSYEQNPSELWAEAVVRYVTGRSDSRRPLAVPEAAVELVAGWSHGSEHAAGP
jgi:hypothetical protein